MFFILNDVDIASYADDNTPYVIADNINGVITSLEKVSKALFEWPENNLLCNADKCHLLVSSSDTVNIRVSKYDIKNSEPQKLVGVRFDNKLKFWKSISLIFVEKLVWKRMHQQESLRKYHYLNDAQLWMLFSIHSLTIVHWSVCVTVARQI